MIVDPGIDASDFGRCRTQHIDERHVHRLPERGRHPLRQIADHRHTPLLAGSVRYQHQAHSACANSSSTASR